MINVRKDTFGGTPAAFELAKILSEIGDIKLVSKVGKKLSYFNAVLRELTKIDTSVNIELAKMMYLDMLEPRTVKGSVPLDERVLTFVNNLLAMRYRVWLKENKGRNPKDNKQKRFHSSAG